jgi:YjbE family integral membrane protein
MMALSFTIQDFWIPLLQVIGVNIVLSGDNAVVVAMAARSLPPKQQKMAVLWGTAVAVMARILLTIFAAKLFLLPCLKLIGAALLCWIGVKLLMADDDKEKISASSHILTAIKIIVMADVVLSLDNVIAVAAAARGSIPLLCISLMISIPIIIFGGVLTIRLMERFPIIITMGACLLGWVAGEMALSDTAIKDWVIGHAPLLLKAMPFAGLLFVLLLGSYLKKKASPQSAAVEFPETQG